MKTILVIGGTGAQGAAVVRFLASTGAYHLILLTRSVDTAEKQFEDISKDKRISCITNNVQHGYDLPAFEKAARRSDGVFINTDGFALGEHAETYWGIRLFETAVQSGVKHIVYSGLDNAFRESGYKREFYVGHYQGKARVQDFIHGQPPQGSIWSIIRSGPYIEMLSEALAPTIENGDYSFDLPLGDGAAPFIHLEDLGRYVHWIFSNPQESKSLDLAVATTHASGQDIAEAFQASTGKRAIYRKISASAWSAVAFEKLPDGHNTKVGFAAAGLLTSAQTFEENFENWWNLYKASAGNDGLIKRDYARLNSLMPDRVKSVVEWMDKTGYKGERIRLLKGTTS